MERRTSWCSEKASERSKTIDDVIQYFAVLDRYGDTSAGSDCESRQWRRLMKWFSLLSLWMKSYGVTIQMKATEQYFSVVLFIMLYKVLSLWIKSYAWCDHSNESY